MNAPRMNPTLAWLFQVAITLLGIATLVALLGEPHLEGRNAHATLFDIYFHDPFLAYVYVGSIPGFMALYRAFGLFGEVRRTGVFSQKSLAALRSIQRCAYAILAFLAGAAVFIVMFGDGEDRPAGVFMVLLFSVATAIVAATAAVLGRNLRRTLQLV